MSTNFEICLNAVEKKLRKNNIIIRGLTCNSSNAKKVVSDFLNEHFNIPDATIDATLIGKDKDRIKATLRNAETKNIVIKIKKSLKTPVFINHDLTPLESKIDKKLREEGKRLSAKGLKVKQGFQKLIVNDRSMIWDLSLDALVPADSAPIDPEISAPTDPGSSPTRMDTDMTHHAMPKN